MADVGDLRVKLSLDNAQFERSVASMNRTLQAMGQEIRGLQNRGKEWGSSITGLSQKQEAYSRLLEAQQTKVRRLAEEHARAVQQHGEHSEQAERLAVQLNRASAEMDRTQRELNEITAELQRQQDQLRLSQSQWTQLGERMQAVGAQMKKVGDKMTAVGKELSMKVTAPIMAFGTAAVMVGMKFEESMSKVAAISGATGDDFKQLEAKAREMGATTNKSASEAADALGYMALAGWDTQQMIGGIEPILKLSAAGNLDLARTSDLVTDSMAALQLEVKDLPDFLDMVAKASQKSNTDIDKLMEAFLVGGGTMAAFNVPLEESTAILGIMANRGYKGAEAGTALNAIFTNLTSGLGASGKAMKELGLSAFDANGDFKGLETVLLEVKKKTESMTDEQRAQYISMIAGKEHLKTFNAILSGLGDEYGDLKNDVSNATGALEQMYKVMTDNLKGRWDEFKSALEEAGISIFKNLQPALESLLGLFQSLVDKFNSLSPTMQNTIIVLAGIAAAIGPVLVVAGVLVSSMGAILTSLGTVSAAIAVVTTGVASAVPGVNALAAVFTALTGPIGIAVAAIAAIGVGAVVVGKEMSESSLQVEGFGNKVSDSTAKAVGGFLKLSDEATVALNQLAWSGEVVTGEMATKMTDMYNQMGEQVLSKMKASHASELEAMTTHFANTSSISQQEEQAILERLQNRYAEQEKATEAGTVRIAEIMSNASAENRILKETEQIEINLIQETMKNNAIKYMSESEVEQKVILERLKNDSSTITAEQAAQVVQNSVKQKNDTVKEAEDQYTEVFKWATRQRDETGVMSAEEAQKVIDDAKHKKNETISNAEEMHLKVVEEAQKQADEHVEKVNWETGEILSKWEVFKNKHSEIFDKIEEYYTKVTDTLKEVTSTAYEFIKKTVEDNLGEVVDFVKEQLDKLKEFWETHGENIKKVVAEAFGFIKADIEMFMGLLKGIFQAGWAVISGIVEGAWKIISGAVSVGMDLILGTIGTIMAIITGDWTTAWETVKETVSKIWTTIKDTFDPTEWFQIGVDIVQGLINGIGSMFKAVGDKIGSLVSTIVGRANKDLDRHSPSRVFRAIGKDVGEGLALGIEDKNDRVSDAMEDLGNNLIDIADHYKSEEKKITDKANAEIEKIEKRSKEDVDKIHRTAASKKRKTTQDENVKIQRIQEDAVKKIAEIEKKATKESVNALTKVQQEKLKEIKLFIDDKKSLGELSLEEEAKIWEQSIDQFDLYSNERVTAQKAYKKAVEDLNKKDLEDIKQYIADKKSSEELSLVEEAKIWERTIGLFEEGSKERIEAQKNYKKAVEAVNKEIVSINKDFQGQMKTISDDLAKQEEQLNKAYEDAFSKRVSSLMSFAGTFDAFKVELNRTGLELMDNLQSQVDGFKNWQDEFAKLSERGIDADLLNELSGLGVKALPELVALNTMTDEQLSKYSELYREKSQLAREQTEKELSGMREDTDIQIQKLREAANEKLNLIQKEWDKAIRNLTRTTANELSSLQQIGIDAGQGLLNGLESMRGPLIDKATEIADAIKDAMSDALDIHSPSRVMRGFGVNIGQGLVLGMDDMINKVANAGARLALSVTQPMDDFNLGNSANSRGGVSTQSYDYSKQFSPSVTIVTQDSGSREMERTLRRMAFGF